MREAHGRGIRLGEPASGRRRRRLAAGPLPAPVLVLAARPGRRAPRARQGDPQSGYPPAGAAMWRGLADLPPLWAARQPDDLGAGPRDLPLDVRAAPGDDHLRQRAADPHVERARAAGQDARHRDGVLVAQGPEHVPQPARGGAAAHDLADRGCEETRGETRGHCEPDGTEIASPHSSRSGAGQVSMSACSKNYARRTVLPKPPPTSSRIWQTCEAL